jgi:hypothetical protein
MYEVANIVAFMSTFIVPNIDQLAALLINFHTNEFSLIPVVSPFKFHHVANGGVNSPRSLQKEVGGSSRRTSPVLFFSISRKSCGAWGLSSVLHVQLPYLRTEEGLGAFVRTGAVLYRRMRVIEI